MRPVIDPHPANHHRGDTRSLCSAQLASNLLYPLGYEAIM